MRTYKQVVEYMKNLTAISLPVFLVMNKIDILAEDRKMLVFDQKEMLLDKFAFLQRTFSISALRNINLSKLVVRVSMVPFIFF